MRIGQCELCGKKDVWVNVMLIGKNNDGNKHEACAECFEKKGPVKIVGFGGRSQPTLDEEGTNAFIYDGALKAMEDECRNE